MTTLRLVAALGILCLPLGALVTPASAATAHNSQAGANGNTKNNAAPIHKRMMKKKSM